MNHFLSVFLVIKLNFEAISAKFREINGKVFPDDPSPNHIIADSVRITDVSPRVLLHILH